MPGIVAERERAFLSSGRGLSSKISCRGRPASFGTALPLNARFQNPVSCYKDALCAALRNRSAGKPILNISTAVLGTVHAERFQARQSDRFGLDFFQASRQRFGVVNRFGRVAQLDVREFVERRFRWHLWSRCLAVRGEWGALGGGTGPITAGVK